VAVGDADGRGAGVRLGAALDPNGVGAGVGPGVADGSPETFVVPQAARAAATEPAAMARRSARRVMAASSVTWQR
jgi:hypothetical protein